VVRLPGKVPPPSQGGEQGEVGRPVRIGVCPCSPVASSCVAVGFGGRHRTVTPADCCGRRRRRSCSRAGASRRARGISPLQKNPRARRHRRAAGTSRCHGPAARTAARRAQDTRTAARRPAASTARSRIGAPAGPRGPPRTSSHRADGTARRHCAAPAHRPRLRPNGVGTKEIAIRKSPCRYSCRLAVITIPRNSECRARS